MHEIVIIANYNSETSELNGRHIGGRILVHCRKIVPFSEVGWLTTFSFLSSLIWSGCSE